MYLSKYKAIHCSVPFHGPGSIKGKITYFASDLAGLRSHVSKPLLHILDPLSPERAVPACFVPEQDTADLHGSAWEQNVSYLN